MASDITLSASMRSALNSMLTTNSQAATAQSRLTTGKKVNSAIDNPASFFTAQGLSNRSSDLKSLLDGMGQAQKTVEAASSGLTAVSKLVESAKGIAKQAASTTDGTLRTELGKQYVSLMKDIDLAVDDAAYNGTNLINSADAANKMTVKFSEKSASKLDVAGVSAKAVDLGITDATSATWPDADAVATSVGYLDTASSKLRSLASSFSTSTAIIGNRQEFTKSITDTLDAGSDALTVADVNEEGAKLLALNTRATISQSALSLASQREQGIARLFG